MKALKLRCAGLLFLSALGYFIDQAAEMRKTPEGKQGEAKEAARVAFVANGSRRLRNAVRNPDAFKLMRVLVMDDGAACYEYRAQNGFGGMNGGRAVLSPDGDLETTETAGFRALWKKECAGKV
jgi:hypothetical protein